MKVAAIIPIGPGHERVSTHAVRSVQYAWAHTHGPFSELQVVTIDDKRGELGRSAARNLGMDNNPADWHFLLDADDKMAPLAFSMIDLAAAATFGAISLGGRIMQGNRCPVTRADLFNLGPLGTLSMGCFIRGDLGLRFDESMDIGEDFDFYMRLPGWTKREKPLAIIGWNELSATGPRSVPKGDWIAACKAVIDKYAKVQA